MSTFPLKIVTPAGLRYEDAAKQLTVRTVDGDVTILPRHMNYVTALGEGRAIVVDSDGARRQANCSRGMLSVQNGAATLISSDFQWQES